MLELLRDNIRALKPYSTARDDYQGPKIDAMLDANENPFGSYNRYPDPRQKELKTLISEIKDIPTPQIFVGNGSDEAIDLMYRLFCQPGVDNVVSIAPTYGMYGVCADINDIELREVSLRADYSLDVEGLLAATDEHTKLLWICSPNNPTGNAFAEQDIETILRRFHGIVVLDEAYIDFSGRPSWLSRLDEFPHLVILQTMSKAWGMAALRCGLAFASAEICTYMDRVKYPYNINMLTQQTVAKALTNHRAAHDQEVATLLSERTRLATALLQPECSAVVKQVYPSDANFLLVQVDDAKLRYQQLLAYGVIVRDRSGLSACPNCLRITIGTPAENDLVIACLRK